MRTLVVLAVLSVCSAFPFIPDDAEVAAEKARFFRTFKVIEGASAPKGGGVPIRPFLPPDAFAPPRPQPKWMGPLASEVPASVPGSTPFVQDTPEVQNARSHFFNTYKSQVDATRPKPGYYYAEPPPASARARAPAPSPAPASGPIYVPDAPPKKWYGPLASAVPASLPGSSPVVFDTPEVSNAKASFFNTYRHQVKSVTPRRFF